MRQAIITLRLDVELLPPVLRQQQDVCNCESDSEDESESSEASGADGHKTESQGGEKHSSGQSQSRELDGVTSQTEGKDESDDESENEQYADEEDGTFRLLCGSNGCRDMARMVNHPTLMVLGSGNFRNYTEDDYD